MDSAHECWMGMFGSKDKPVLPNVYRIRKSSKVKLLAVTKRVTSLSVHERTDVN